MSLMPVVVSIDCTDNTATLVLNVSPTLDYFPGHFPGFPILPGVVQVDWAIRFAREHLGIPATGFSALRGLKFSAPILPGASLKLQLSWHPEKQRLDFSYNGERRPVSSGQVVFAAEAAA